MFCRKKGKTDHNIYSASPIATPNVYIYIYICLKTLFFSDAQAL